MSDTDYKRAVWESLEIAIQHAKVADSPFEFLVNQIQAMHNTEFLVNKRTEYEQLKADAERYRHLMLNCICKDTDNCLSINIPVKRDADIHWDNREYWITNDIDQARKA